MMINKITAGEAIILTEAHNKKVRLFDMIRHMCTLGYYYILADLTEEETAYFKELGYKVTPDAAPVLFKISWETIHGQ